MRLSVRTVTAASAFLAAGTCHAMGGILGVSGGANYWSHSPSGEQEFSGAEADLEDDLGLEGSEDVQLWAEWDHFVPIIPSVRAERTTLEEDGSGTLSLGTDYGDISNNTSVDSNLDLGHTELTLYWSPLGLVPWVDVDVGVTGKYFDGELTVDDGGTKETFSFSGPVPMLYGRAGLDIPATRFRIEASMKEFAISDSSITDSQVRVAYKWWYAGAMLGYRKMAVEFDDFDDTLTVDADFSGPYAGVFARF